MADALIIKCRTQLSCEQLRTILDHLKAQKENGVILLPPYLEAQTIPDDIEIKLIDERGEPVE
jgi:hypothetical protein|nr:MAG TPA: hypothetical protein [Caudoviricetes sp.]